eukprot:TRINITY_DN4863_c0_g4_i1.p1 TRINITY_DN4863_c0_g4~~TRINITY_DN4863_c0_g4_i1.p1  ORF type:complete len:521 (+),score=73.77 TRINITY_DN4863_c0_g4_i1:163-1725(+)
MARSLIRHAFTFILTLHSICPWDELLTLDAEDGLANDNFGRSVAITETYLAVGASGACGPGVDKSLRTGVVYLYMIKSKAWSFSTMIAPLGITEFALSQFGAAVALSGNVLLIGAPKSNQPDAYNSGSAYFYEYNNQDWVFNSKITAPRPLSSSYFGITLSLIPGVALVGSTSANANNFMWSGAVYVYRRLSGKWTWNATLISPRQKSYEHLGRSVALSDWLIAASAPNSYHPSLNIRSGSVFLYKPINSTWIFHQEILPYDPVDSMDYGASIGLYEDMLAIGSSFSNSPISKESGIVYMYRFINNTWTLLTTVYSQWIVRDSMFGCRLHYSGKFLHVIGNDYKMYVFEFFADRWQEIQSSNATEVVLSSSNYYRVRGFMFANNSKGMIKVDYEPRMVTQTQRVSYSPIPQSATLSRSRSRSLSFGRTNTRLVDVIDSDKGQSYTLWIVLGSVIGTSAAGIAGVMMYRSMRQQEEMSDAVDAVLMSGIQEQTKQIASIAQEVAILKGARSNEYGTSAILV